MSCASFLGLIRSTSGVFYLSLCIEHISIVALGPFALD